MHSTIRRKRPQTARVAGKPRVPRGPDEPHDLNVTGLTEREVAALADIARRRTEAARSTGAVITRNALIVATLRNLIASEGAQ
jgi:hypothetical protein